MADLRSRSSFHGLDIMELRAVWHCLPPWTGDNPKAEWRREFKRKLDLLAAQEITGEIDPDEARHPDYDVRICFKLFRRTPCLVTMMRDVL
jgi:hypothetical protein